MTAPTQEQTVAHDASRQAFTDGVRAPRLPQEG